MPDSTSQQKTAEGYLRGRYGAYRGHPCWRELEEAFLAGRTSEIANRHLVSNLGAEAAADYCQALGAIAAGQAVKPDAAGVSDADILVVAEFVGLIGPGSRVGESHGAAVRFARAILALRPQAVPMTEADAAFEQWYVENTPDLAANPVGSRDCGLQRKAWNASARIVREPMTDEQIESLLVNWPKDGIAFFDFARAAEAHHGITRRADGGEVGRG